MTIKNARELTLEERSAFRIIYTEFFEESSMTTGDLYSTVGRRLKKFIFSKNERYATEMLRKVYDGSYEAVIGFEGNYPIGFIVGVIDNVEGDITHFYCSGGSFIRKRSNELRLLKAFSSLAIEHGANRLCAHSEVTDEDLSNSLKALGFNYTYTWKDINNYSRSTIM